jgi:hypothetical protein
LIAKEGLGHSRRMNVDTWAVVLATIVGPIAAVFITRWNDQRREARNRLLHVYRILMATRRSNVSQDHVAAINLVEVEFHGVKPVIEAWSAYLTHLNTTSADDQAKAWNDRRSELLAILLVKIAAHLGITKGEDRNSPRRICSSSLGDPGKPARCRAGLCDPAL